jgi:Mrr N-terminal domain
MQCILVPVGSSDRSIISRSIEIDDEVWGALKAQAEPLVDSPNTVLRRVLRLAPADGTSGEAISVVRDQLAAKRTRGSRAPVGSLLPESEYELPILQVLAERGGSAPAREVINAVGQIVADRLTELDREDLPNGGQRWQNRVQFTRLRLKERGLIETGSPRGLWELAHAGEQVVASHEIKN